MIRASLKTLERASFRTLHCVLSVFVRRVAWITLGGEWLSLRERVQQLVKALQRGELGTPTPETVELLVSGEDHRFRLHAGFDLVACMRALTVRLTTGCVQGASTIPQQLVRVVSGRYERTVGRKVREVLLASLLDAEFSKPVIAQLYLALAYYGTGLTGYGAACAKLSISAAAPTVGQAAQIVARLKYPEPRHHSPAAIQRIERRVLHLLRLYSIHKIDGTHLTSDGRKNANKLLHPPRRLWSEAPISSVGDTLGVE